MKNITAVLILRFGVCGDKPDVVELFRTQEDELLAPLNLRSLQSLRCSKPWNRLALKYSQSDDLFQCVPHLLDKCQCMFVRASLYMRTEENQLDATECFTALIICSTYFGHLYAHHQELETVLVLLPHMVCSVLVAGGRLLGAEQQALASEMKEICHHRKRKEP